MVSQNAPTRDELLQAPQSIVVDCYSTYKAIESLGGPVVSIGQWRRIKAAQALIGREADATSA